MNQPAYLSDKQKTLLVLNGVGLVLSALVSGWLYFFNLLGAIDLWPFITDLDAQIPGDRRAWNMAHLEGITNGLLLLALATTAPFIRLTPKMLRVMTWCWIIFGWMFTLPAIANALFGTRGLEFGGGPFEGNVIINNIIFLSGWPAMIAVHIGIPLAFWGALKHYKNSKTSIS